MAGGGELPPGRVMKISQKVQCCAIDQFYDRGCCRHRLVGDPISES